MPILYVTYPGDVGARFDREYYVKTHLPLVMESWRKYGLETVAAFFPEGSGEGTIAICACSFRDETAIRESFAAPEACKVMDDIAHFTNAIPSQNLLTSL